MCVVQFGVIQVIHAIFNCFIALPNASNSSLNSKLHWTDRAQEKRRRKKKTKEKGKEWATLKNRKLRMKGRNGRMNPVQFVGYLFDHDINTLIFTSHHFNYSLILSDNIAIEILSHRILLLPALCCHCLFRLLIVSGWVVDLWLSKWKIKGVPNFLHPMCALLLPLPLSYFLCSFSITYWWFCSYLLAHCRPFIHDCKLIYNSDSVQLLCNAMPLFLFLSHAMRLCV